MNRVAFAFACLALTCSGAFAQTRQATISQDARPGPGAAQCRIAEIVVARGGAGFVCDMGSDGRVLMATDGGTQPGGVSAFMSWILDAKNSQTSARAHITVNYEAADTATQAVCDASALRGQTARQPITCYRILALVD